MLQTILEVSGMTCGGCVNMVKATLSKMKGVKSVTVTLDPPEAAVSHEGKVVPKVIIDYLEENTHYKAKEKKD